MGRLDGRVAVVVGAGQTEGETMGNGRATAITFAREGASLVLVDRDAASLAETARLTGTDPSQVVADIASDEGPDRAIAAAVEAFGRIDVLHNNVGIGAGDGPPHRVAVRSTSVITSPGDTSWIISSLPLRTERAAIADGVGIEKIRLGSSAPGLRRRSSVGGSQPERSSGRPRWSHDDFGLDAGGSRRASLDGRKDAVGAFEGAVDGAFVCDGGNRRALFVGESPTSSMRRSMRSILQGAVSGSTQSPE